MQSSLEKGHSISAVSSLAKFFTLQGQLQTSVRISSDGLASVSVGHRRCGLHVSSIDEGRNRKCEEEWPLIGNKQAALAAAIWEEEEYERRKGKGGGGLQPPLRLVGLLLFFYLRGRRRLLLLLQKPLFGVLFLASVLDPVIMKREATSRSVIQDYSGTYIVISVSMPATGSFNDI